MVVDLSQFESAIRGIRSARTANSYHRIATAFLTTLGSDRQPLVRDVESFLERKATDGRRRAASTRNQELAGLRALARFAQREGIWTSDPTIGIEFAKVPRQDAVFFTSQELQRLFIAAHDDPSPLSRSRNVAFLALLSQVGLRVHEVVGLNLDQIDLSQEVLIGVRGKGGTVADLPISLEVAVVLSRWVTARARIAHTTESALFVSRLGRRISIRSVERVIAKLRVWAGIAKLGSCHSLRHSMATLSLELGTDIGTISEILRHSSVAITQRYIHCFDGRRRDAVRRLARTIPREIVAGTELKANGAPVVPLGYPKKVIDDQGFWDDVA